MKYSTIFDFIAEEFKKAGIKHILVGGFAVNAYEVSRNTKDVDFLIQEEDFPKVKDILMGSGYINFQKHDLFARFSGETYLPMDILFADNSTFEKMFSDGKSLKISGKQFRVPSLEHLIAMKLHALKNNFPERRLTDLSDVVKLLKRHNFDVQTPEFKKLCLKYSNEKVYEKIQEHFKEIP